MKRSLPSLRGQEACVTGGSSGIGLAVVRWLAARDARVHMMSRTSTQSHESLDGLAGLGSVTPIDCDVRSADDLVRAEATFRETSERLDVLVVCAGVNTRSALFDLSDEWLRDILDTNLYGAIATVRAFARLLLDTPNSRVVLVGSALETHGMSNMAAYAASKVGIAGFVRSLAVEWGPRDVRVNGVAPGLTETEMTKENLTPAKRALIKEYSPIQRPGTPEEIASVVGFLVTPASRFVTGQIVVADGGMTSGSRWW